MSLFGPLDHQVRSYRKRVQIPLDGTAGGLASPRRHGGYKYAGSEFIARGSGPAGPSQYLGPWPHDYEPDPGQLEPSVPEYEPYEGHRVFHATTPPLTVGPGWIDVPVPEEVLQEELEAPGYNEALMNDELSEIAWQQVLPSACDSEPISLDGQLATEDAVNPPESLEQIIDHEMAFMQMQEIEDAIEQQINEAMAPPEPQLPDAYEMQEMLEQQMQQLMDPFNMGPGPMM